MKTKKELPSISDNEWEIVDLLWQQTMTASRIVEILQKKFDWSDKTIKTMIFRLVKKQVLHFTTQGREYVYEPLVNRSDYLKQEGRSFLDRVFKGATGPLISHFLREQKLTDRELEEISRMIEEAKREREL